MKDNVSNEDWFKLYNLMRNIRLNYISSSESQRFYANTDKGYVLVEYKAGLVYSITPFDTKKVYKTSDIESATRYLFHMGIDLNTIKR